MQFRWLRQKVRRRARRPRKVSKASALHYETHKERARILIHEKLQIWSLVYGTTYNRVTIRNQRSRWGSCSARGNLNFNYRLIFLPEPLFDYVIVHELCHLIELNHSNAFWEHVERALPDYRERKVHLRSIPSSMLFTETVV